MNIEQDLIGEIKGLNIIIKRKMFEQYKDKDRQPSPLQFKILAYLAHHSDAEINQKDLEESLNVNKATISGALNTMEKQGLIKRTTSSIDEARGPVPARAGAVARTERGTRLRRDDGCARVLSHRRKRNAEGPAAALLRPRGDGK